MLLRHLHNLGHQLLEAPMIYENDKVMAQQVLEPFLYHDSDRKFNFLDIFYYTNSFKLILQVLNL